MVEPEQILEATRVVFVLLQLFDQTELLVDEGLVTPRQRFEHVVDLAPQGGLLAGKRDGLTVHVVHRACKLADFLVGADRYTGEVDVVDTGTCANSFDRVGESASCCLQCGKSQPTDRIDERSADDEGDGQCQQDRAEHDCSVTKCCGSCCIGFSGDGIAELGDGGVGQAVVLVVSGFQIGADAAPQRRGRRG